MVGSSFSYNQQEGMTREDKYEKYTIRKHGFKLVRTHLHDWIILILLVAIEVGLNKINPFYRFVGKHMMTDLQYPFHPNTIPIWAVPIYSVVLPIIIFIIRYLKRRDVHDLHHAILGILYATLITGVITDSIKDAVGRPRPNFFYRCFPDGKAFYDQLGDVICHGNPADVKEGHKSFPSGHTSWSFAGLGFLSLYLSGKIQVFDGKGHIGKLCVMFLPLLIASLVGVSRVDDYWHHWTDVFAGGLIGLSVSFFCYLQAFPPPNRHQGWGPYSYFATTAAANAHNDEPNEHMLVTSSTGVQDQTTTETSLQMLKDESSKGERPHSSVNKHPSSEGDSNYSRRPLTQSTPDQADFSEISLSGTHAEDQRLEAEAQGLNITVEK